MTIGQKGRIHIQGIIVRDRAFYLIPHSVSKYTFCITNNGPLLVKRIPVSAIQIAMECLSSNPLKELNGRGIRSSKMYVLFPLPLPSRRPCLALSSWVQTPYPSLRCLLPERCSVTRLYVTLRWILLGVSHCERRRGSLAPRHVTEGRQGPSTSDLAVAG